MSHLDPITERCLDMAFNAFLQHVARSFMDSLKTAHERDITWLEPDPSDFPEDSSQEKEVSKSSLLEDLMDLLQSGQITQEQYMSISQMLLQRENKVTVDRGGVVTFRTSSNRVIAWNRLLMES